MLLISVILSVLLTGLFAAGHGQAGESSWPDIAPLEVSVYFADVSKASALFKILGPKGKPLYVLQCYNWRNPRDRDFNYSGDFECRLTSTYAHDPADTLLSEPHHTREWQSRGRVLGDELAGKCADYPEYGKVRHFRLRKMKITFVFDELSFQPFRDPSTPKVKKLEFQSLRFTLKVEPDPAALSAVAEPVPFTHPPPSSPDDPNDLSLKCDVVIKRK